MAVKKNEQKGKQKLEPAFRRRRMKRRRKRRVDCGMRGKKKTREDKTPGERFRCTRK